MFGAGEEAVTRDLLPLAFDVASERRLGDELFVTAWLWEEGKHADFFRRFHDEVVGEEPSVSPRARQLQRLVLEQELPQAMNRLLADPSPAAQARALTTYCLIVEGVLADTGQRVFEEALEANDLLPGLRAGLQLVNRDESRHVAYGLHVLRRLIDADSAIEDVVIARARELGPAAKALVDAVVLQFETRPFGISDALQNPAARFLGQLERLAS
jgi:ribonucleoside-diphosphate reductase beta chain